MRRAVLPVLVGCALVSTGALAKFGMSKTRVPLTRYRPPDIALLGNTVAVEVASDARSVTSNDTAHVRDRVEDALRAWGVVRVVEPGGRADDVVRVSIDSVTAHIRDTVRFEDRYVKIGEREEWDDKKKKTVTKDVYGNRREPIQVKVLSGSVSARVRVTTPDGLHEADASSTYDRQLDEKDRMPPEAYSEDTLERVLVDAAAAHAVAAVCFSPEPLQVMLAVNGELKAGNQRMLAGQLEEALTEWSRRTFKGDTEAARLHNIGVAHEALAYKLPVDSPGHLRQLEEAAESYRKARDLDPGEKYFAEPLQRIETSTVYARAAADLTAARARWAAHDRAERPPQATTRAPAKPPAPAGNGGPSRAAPARPGPTPGPTSDEWTFDHGSFALESGRGKVLELDGSSRPVSATQKMDVSADAGAAVRLEYKVVTGEAQVRVRVGYEDEGAKPRVATLEVSLGEKPGGWSTWKSDLGRLRPRPSRVTDVKVLVEGGTVRVDNLAVGGR
jgi:hypothetical protein